MTAVLEQARRPAARSRRRAVRGRALRLAPAWLLLTVGAATMLLPLLFIAVNAFKTPADYDRSALSLPRHPTLANFSDAWRKAGFSHYMLNSVGVVGISVIIVVTLSATAGYAFSFLDFPFRDAGLTTVVAMMILPVSALLVPTFEVVNKLHLLDSYTGLVVVYVAISLPFGVYVMASFFKAVPSQLLEAAWVDGASTLQTFTRIALPLALPALKTLTILTSLSLWNELLFALVIMQSPGHRTLTSGLALLQVDPASGGHPQTTVQAAALALAALPPFVIYLIFNRTVAQGLTAGALK